MIHQTRDKIRCQFTWNSQLADLFPGDPWAVTLLHAWWQAGVRQPHSMPIYLRAIDLATVKEPKARAVVLVFRSGQRGDDWPAAQLEVLRDLLPECEPGGASAPEVVPAQPQQPPPTPSRALPTVQAAPKQPQRRPESQRSLPHSQRRARAARR